MHFFWCPQGAWKQQNNSTAGKVIFWTYKSGDVVSFFLYKLSGLWNLFISFALKISIFVNDEDVNSTRGKLVIVNTYKLIVVTVLKSGKIGSDYGFIYFLVSTENLKATK